MLRSSWHRLKTLALSALPTENLALVFELCSKRPLLLYVGQPLALG